MTKEKKNIIEVSKLEWYSMQVRPRKMKCDKDTSKELIKIFGNKIIDDIEIIEKEVKKKDDD